ncbi:MAG: phosphatidylserine decarboxylase [Endomicrobiia bacterium]
MKSGEERSSIFKKGLPIIAFFIFLLICSFGLSLVFDIFKYVNIVLFITTIIVTYFFRDPRRSIVNDSEVIYSPADGKIIEITDSGEEYCIKIFMNIFNVHVQRSPVDGMVKKVLYKEGKFYPARQKNTEYLNEQNLIEIWTTDFVSIKILQIAGFVARRIVCLVKEGEVVKQGQKIGYIMLGSQVNLILPKSSVELLVKEGKKVFAGITKIGFKK